MFDLVREILKEMGHNLEEEQVANLWPLVRFRGFPIVDLDRDGSVVAAWRMSKLLRHP